MKRRESRKENKEVMKSGKRFKKLHGIWIRVYISIQFKEFRDGKRVKNRGGWEGWEGGRGTTEKSII